MRPALALLAITAFLAGTLPGGQAEPPPPEYLSLGDSLAASMQPDPDGHDRKTAEGFSEHVLRARSHAAPALSLVKLGRGGETAASLINGKKRGPSQLEQAEGHLRAGTVAFVTIDIGANEVEGCNDGQSFDNACVERGLRSLRHSLPAIIARLRRAGGSNLRIVGINYYNSFLGRWVTGPAGRKLALASIPVERRINATLARLYAKAHVPVADVESRFQTRAMNTYVNSRFGRVPLAVANTCRWTWACSSRYDDHTNSNGYMVIARAVLSQLA